MFCATGLFSSTVGTMAGPMVMQGFVGLRIPLGPDATAGQLAGRDGRERVLRVLPLQSLSALSPTQAGGAVPIRATDVHLTDLNGRQVSPSGMCGRR